MYLKDNNPDAAAQVLLWMVILKKMQKIYDQAGEKLDAGIALEKAGRRLAASRAYREAGDHNAHLSFLRKRA